MTEKLLGRFFYSKAQDVYSSHNPAGCNKIHSSPTNWICVLKYKISAKKTNICLEIIYKVVQLFNMQLDEDSLICHESTTLGIHAYMRGRAAVCAFYALHSKTLVSRGNSTTRWHPDVFAWKHPESHCLLFKPWCVSSENILGMGAGRVSSLPSTPTNGGGGRGSSLTPGRADVEDPESWMLTVAKAHPWRPNVGLERFPNVDS